MQRAQQHRYSAFAHRNSMSTIPRLEVRCCCRWIQVQACVTKKEERSAKDFNLGYRLSILPLGRKFVPQVFSNWPLARLSVSQFIVIGLFRFLIQSCRRSARSWHRLNEQWFGQSFSQHSEHDTQCHCFGCTCSSIRVIVIVASYDSFIIVTSIVCFVDIGVRLIAHTHLGAF